jgi:hypothetical protein
VKALARRPLGIALLAAAVAGCAAIKGGKPRLDSAGGMFDKAQVSYRVEAARINQASPSRGVEGQLVSYQSPVVGRLPAGAMADVQIEFPHPEKRDGYAQVTVRVEAPHGQESAQGKWWTKVIRWSPLKGRDATVVETWVLDIPQNELSGIINDLHNSGYFTSYAKTAAGAQIQTQLDGAKVAKAWRQVPQLDALVVRVRTQGRLLSNPKGPASTLFKGLAGPAPSSVVAYRKLEETDAVAIVSDLNAPALPTADAFQVVRLPAVDARTIRR